MEQYLIPCFSKLFFISIPDPHAHVIVLFLLIAASSILFLSGIRSTGLINLFAICSFAVGASGKGTLRSITSSTIISFVIPFLILFFFFLFFFVTSCGITGSNSISDSKYSLLSTSTDISSNLIFSNEAFCHFIKY
eukprot:NODE_441_length_8548_cov_0.413185.p7 type:complete len:136 gc:universal NODE_441_length_8548_cov_0.413185:1931-1524(-)